jgi:hypothetical protein
LSDAVRKLARLRRPHPSGLEVEELGEAQIAIRVARIVRLHGVP